MSKASRARWSAVNRPKAQIGGHPSVAVSDRPRAEQMIQGARALGLMVAGLVHSNRQRVEGVQAIAAEAAAVAAPTSSCKAGCAFCCKAGRFQVIPDEVTMLAPHVSPAAWDRVRALAGMDQDEAERRDCPLLDPVSRMCSVYDHRPTICRTYFVVSPASVCETDGSIKVNADPAVFTMQFAAQLFPANPFTGILWRELVALAPRVAE